MYLQVGRTIYFEHKDKILTGKIISFYREKNGSMIVVVSSKINKEEKILKIPYSKIL